jgi:hypothetical protein
MARFNTVTGSATVAAVTSTLPNAGLFTTLTGTAGYTVTLASPAAYIGVTQTFFNTTSGNCTIAAPTGNITGPGLTSATSQTIPTNAVLAFISDGTNYILVNNEGGQLVGTTGIFSSTLTANGAVNMNAVNNNISIAPTGTGTVTINPAVVGNIDKVNIGATTAGDIKVNTLTLNTQLTGTGTIDGGTF